MSIRHSLLAPIACIACCFYLTAQSAPIPQGVDPDGSSKPVHGDWGVDLQYLSANIKPGDNFYEFVNEGWLTTTELPAGRAFLSAPWVVQDMVNEQTRDIIIEAVTEEPGPGTAGNRIRDFYQSYLDSGSIEERGLSVLQDDLDEMMSIDNHGEVARWMGNPRSNSIFHLLVQPPVDMQGGYVLTLAQYRVTGLGLPGQVYFQSDNAPYPEIRKAYTDYISATLDAAQVDRPADRAADVLRLETRLASLMWDFAKLREAGASFNLIPLSELERIAPGFPWNQFLAARGVNDIEHINIGVGAIRASAELFTDIPVDSWVSYLAFHWIDNHAFLLDDAFGMAAFDFHERELFGIEERPSRETRAASFVERYLGDDIGHLYTERHLPRSSREHVEEMIHYIRIAFREQLETTRWMDQRTRDEAIAKLDAIVIEIGEPRTGIDWENLKTEPDDLIGNFARLIEYRWEADRRRIGTPVTRFGGWNMHPHAIGAGYHQQYNKIFITAGALLPPFFDPNADPAVNFGAIGQTVAHEFGHALDDQGSRFDKNGALRDWWSPESRQAYERRTSGLIEQYKEYEPVPGAKLNAEQMIGEIVGDLTGTSIAYLAYQMYAEDHYESNPPILDGYSGEQRFFLATAQQSRTIANNEALRDIAAHETHPPAEFRINGVLKNLGAWYQNFRVGPDDAMYRRPDARIELW